MLCTAGNPAWHAQFTWHNGQQSGTASIGASGTATRRTGAAHNVWTWFAAAIDGNVSAAISTNASARTTAWKRARPPAMVDPNAIITDYILLKGRTDASGDPPCPDTSLLTTAQIRGVLTQSGRQIYQVILLVDKDFPDLLGHRVFA